MFYENLNKLCEKRVIKLTPLLKELKISTGNITRWKNGSVPNSSTLIKLAEYFGVSTDELLGVPDKDGSEDLRFAFSDINGDLSDMSEEDIEDVRNYIAFKKAQKKGDKR